jgi:polyferredoxin
LAFFVVVLIVWAFPCFLIGLLAVPLCGAVLFFVVLAVLAFSCFLIGLLALPLCGAAPTFFAAAKKVGKEDSFKPLILKRVPRSA